MLFQRDKRGFGKSAYEAYNCSITVKTIAKIPTLKDVAAQAGVSLSTASRALSQPHKVAAKTRTSVTQAARQLGYQPNEMARGLRQRSSRVLGYLVNNLTNNFQAQIIKGVQDTLFDKDFTLIIGNTNEDSKREQHYLEDLQRYHLQGLIVVPTHHTKQRLKDLLNIPVIEVDRASGRTQSHVVLTDNTAGAAAAVGHLIELGHQRIAHISGDPNITTGAERLAGYQQALDASGLPFDDTLWEVATSHDEEAGYQAALRLLDKPETLRPTAIFAFNSEVTAGVLRASQNLGIAIPSDLSLIGFDDSRWAQLVTPRLSVVAQPAYEMGCVATERLLSALENPALPGTTTRLGTQLILRDSTAAPNHQ